MRAGCGADSDHGPTLHYEGTRGRGTRVCRRALKGGNALHGARLAVDS